MAQISIAQTISEAFNYAENALLKDQSGWSVSTGTTNPLSIYNESFASIGLQSAKHVRINGSSTSEVTSLDILSLNNGNVVREDGTYYFAMAVNVASAGTGSGDYFATISGGMNQAGTSLNARGRVFARAKDGKLAFGISWGSNGYQDTDGIYDFNKSYIIVFKHIPGNKIGHLFIFESFIPAIEPSLPQVSNSSSTEGFINGKEIAFRQNSSSLNMALGGIIASTSWPTGMTITKTTLPINLIDFKAVQENSAVRLNWSTASERNNNRFEILKSTDGVKFNVIGQVNGNQNSYERKDYTFIDKSYSTAIVYYKLKQIDNDGKSEEFSSIVLKMAKLNNNEIVVFKDNNGLINANFNSDKGLVNASIYTIEGKKITKVKATLNSDGKQNLIFKDSLAAGVYIMNILIDNRFVTCKFVL